ncbi:MAG TPA: MFS transporter [Candidatus Polarisedimenticolia bacterium]|nr:MFS transporter [Candidatus Polarisedimenticolia bacterium]
MAAPTGMTASAPRLARHPDFLKLWTAETVSVFGTQITLLALPLVAATILKVTPFEFGLLGTIEFLPFILLSLPAGVWVDRLRRRPILIIGDLGRAIALSSIPVAFYFDVLSIWQLYVVGFITGCLTVFFDVAYQSYLPSLVERDQLVEGNSKLEITRSASQIAGPGLAGVLIGLVRAPFAILLDALSFVVSAIFVFWIRKPEPPIVPHNEDTGPRPSMRSEIAGGLRYVTGHRWLRSIAATTGVSNLFGNLGGAILLLYLVRDHGFSPEQLGFAFSLGSFGVLGAALTAGRVSKALGLGRTLVISSLGFSAAGLVIVVSPPELLFYAVALSILMGGYFGVVWNINQVSLRQAITPLRMQGKMNATMRFIVWGGIPIGNLVGGFLGGVIGLYPTIVVGALGGLVAFLPVALSEVRKLKTMPEQVGDDAAEPAAPAAAGA